MSTEGSTSDETDGPLRRAEAREEVLQLCEQRRREIEQARERLLTRIRELTEMAAARER
jgi:hypothetical protein